MIKNNILLKTITICFLSLSIYSCKDDQFGAPLKVEIRNLSIYEYLKANPAYSTLVSALDLTKVSEGLNVYGSMTLFAPTNDAFQKYFERKGISGISDINADSLKQLLNYHIYAEKIAAAFFPVIKTTVAGDFIYMDNSLGLKQTVLNNSVTIDSIDVPASNGLVHVIADVLEPPKKTVYTYLQGNPDYSIMAEAISKTGLDTALLNKVIYDNSTKIPTKKFVTFLAEPDALLKQKGINSFDDLAKKYSSSYNSTKNYTGRSDSLNIFIRYHCVQNKYFSTEFIDDVYETANPGSY
jgi:uncharacterized surface protein with fasciclin (FAS1) repeats